MNGREAKRVGVLQGEGSKGRGPGKGQRERRALDWGSIHVARTSIPVQGTCIQHVNSRQAVSRTRGKQCSPLPAGP